MMQTTFEPHDECVTKFIREGRWVAEVDVTLLHTGHDWSPYLSSQDVCRLDGVRAALRLGDVAAAAREARVFELRAVAA